MIIKNIKRHIAIFMMMTIMIVSLPKIACAQLYGGDIQKISGTSDASVKLPNTEYTENTIDLRVKVLGGEVKLNRTWVNGRWYINPAWANLRFILDPLDNSVKTIDRAGSMYQRTGDEQLYTYEHVSIKKTDSGWHWFDQQGNWINFDDKGRILEYGDTNNVKVSFTLDKEGRRIAIKDHFDEQVYSFTYDNQERLIKVSDREGRAVSYEWSGNKLVKVTDVLGHSWHYGYDVNGQLNQKTEPDGGVIKIDYTVSPPAPKTAMMSGKEGGIVSKNAVVTTGSDNRDTKLAQVGKITNKTGAVTIYNSQYNRVNKQYTITVNDPLGKKTVTVFDAKGRVITKTVNDSIIGSYQRDKANHLVKYTNQRGLTTTTQYNQSDYPIKITYPNGATELYEYNKANKPIKITNTKGDVISLEYDASNNPIKVVYAVGKPEQRIISFNYDNYGQQISATISGGGKTINLQRTFDRYGNIATYTDGKGYQFQYTHNLQGQIKTVRNPLQQLWQFNYNLAGYLTESIDPLNHSVSLSTDGMGRLTKVVDALGNKTQYSYNFNQNGYETKVVDALNQATTYQYDSLYRLVKTISPTGLVTQQTYNIDDKLIQEVDVAGNVFTYEYGTKGSDLAGLLTKVVYPTFTETYNYNALDKVTEINQRLDADTTLTNHRIYDQLGLMTSVIDAANRTSQTEYNALGQVVKSIDALGHETRYLTDLLDNIIQVTDANGNQYAFEYDKNNNLIRETKTLGNDVEYSYNQANQLIEQKQANGNRIQYQYDAAGNLIKQSYVAKGQSAPSQVVAYSYNQANQLIDVLQTGDTHTHFVYQHDKLGRVTQETITYGTGANSITKILQYVYDKEGNLVSITYPDNSKVTYKYNKNQLKQATLANGEVINWSDYRWFMPSKVTYPNATQTNQYDSLLRPSVIGLTANRKTLLNRQYSYDKVSNITRIQTENGENNYQYDLLDRLILAKPSPELQNSGLAVESYNYDAIGNRIGSAQQPGEWEYNKFNQLIKWGEGTSQTTLTYTPNSQLATEVNADKTLSYHYNVAERLISVNDENTELATYQYDPFGRRISKTINGDITYFIYTDEGLIAELDHHGKLTVAYGWVPDTEWGTSPLWQVSLTANQTLQTASYHYLITDHLGTPQLAINNQGQQTWKIYNDAFGNTVLDPNNQITLNLRFPGQYYDQETGLYYNYFRDYNPKIGRYIQSDPIGLNGGINTFGYVGGNPVLYRDPYGKSLAIPQMYLPAAVEWCLAGPVGCAVAVAGVGVVVGVTWWMANKTCESVSANIGRWSSGVAASGAPGSPNPNDEEPDDNDKNKNRKFKVKKPKVSGKDGAKDVPDWAKPYRPYVGENGKQFAKRVMDDKYGKRKHQTGADTEFSKIKKWADRSFMDPKK